MRYLAADFGSTYTKLTAIDSRKAEIVGTASAFTTISTNIMHSFETALERLQADTGGFSHDQLLCCSSAGGGLIMVVIGLASDLTAQAATIAAESAGAKVIVTFSHELSGKEQDEIYAIQPDIVLVSGGTNGGDKEFIIRNTRLLCSINRDFTILVAGNESAAAALEPILRSSGKEYVITQNVLPCFGELNIAPAGDCVRDIFIRRIIAAKGLAQVQAMADSEIVPTPLSVLRACELFSLGTEKTPGFGEFMAVDLGGATTDVYSLAKGEKSLSSIIVQGLPEPYAKRTVEGDLGMRYSARFLLDAAGADLVAEIASMSMREVVGWVEKCVASPEICAQRNSAERKMDEALARFAIAHAVERHCGVLERTYTPLGEAFILTGKDLSGITKVVGIGGVLTNSDDPAAILSGAAASARSRADGRTVPNSPRYFLDKRYIFSAMGLLSQVDPELALTLMKREVVPLAT